MSILEQLNSYHENMLSVDECQSMLLEYGKSVDGFIIYGAMQTGIKLKRILEMYSLKVLGFLDEYVELEIYDGGGVYHNLADIKKKYSHVCFLISSHLETSQEIMKTKLYSFFENVDILNRDILFYCNHNHSLKRNDGVRWEKVDVIITNYCTLRCKDCCTLTPYVSLEHRRHLPLDELERDLKSLNETVDSVVNLDIIGGEPLLYPHLSELIYFVHGLSNFYQIMVDTNGTIVPERKVIKALIECGVIVHITDYGEVSNKKEKVIEELERNDVLVACRASNLFAWYDFGEIFDRGNGDKQWNNCHAKDCPTVYDGKFHICTRDLRYIERNLYIPNEEEHVELRNSDLSRRREVMKNLYKRDLPITGCRFCGGAINKIKDGTQGIQINKNGA